MTDKKQISSPSRIRGVKDEWVGSFKSQVGKLFKSQNLIDKGTLLCLGGFFVNIESSSKINA